MMKNEGHIGIMENILETTIDFRAYWLPGFLPEGSTSMLYIDIYIYTHLCVCIYIYICMQLFVCKCVYIYIYICIHFWQSRDMHVAEPALLKQNLRWSPQHDPCIHVKALLSVWQLTYFEKQLQHDIRLVVSPSRFSVGTCMM